jgi:acetyl esterase
MPLDPDAEALMQMIKQAFPCPVAGTDAATYRAASSVRLAPHDPLKIDRVETFEIAGKAGALTVRLYVDGTGAELRPTLIYYHGGGFVTCNIDTHDDFCRTVAQESGWAILSVDYRLAPEHPYPAALDDAYAALVWAASSAGTARGIDAARIGVGGDSAGGAIAASVAIAARGRGGPAIAHQLLIYPVIDVGFDTASYRDNGTDYFLTTEAMRWFWDQYLGTESHRTDPLAVPGREADLSGLPAATVITAGYDPLRDEGADYAARLRAAGVPVTYRCFEGAFHGFAGMDTLACAKEARALMVDRLKQAA